MAAASEGRDKSLGVLPFEVRLTASCRGTPSSNEAGGDPEAGTHGTSLSPHLPDALSLRPSLLTLKKDSESLLGGR